MLYHVNHKTYTGQTLSKGKNKCAFSFGGHWPDFPAGVTCSRFTYVIPIAVIHWLDSWNHMTSSEVWNQWLLRWEFSLPSVCLLNYFFFSFCFLTFPPLLFVLFALVVSPCPTPACGHDTLATDLVVQTVTSVLLSPATQVLFLLPPVTRLMEGRDKTWHVCSRDLLMKDRGVGVGWFGTSLSKAIKCLISWGLLVF